MLRGFVGKIFGLEGENQELHRQSRELSWDSSFGMWTRNAFLQFYHVMQRDVRRVAFLDMNKIHTLNEVLGYTEVDRRIKETFSVPFRRAQDRTARRICRRIGSDVFCRARSVGSRQDDDRGCRQ